MASTTEEASVRKAWETFDVNRNGFLSLAECDRAIVEILPKYAKNKPAILRAYKAADISQDGYIQYAEFKNLVKLLEVYDHMWKSFKSIDTDMDRRIDVTEFLKGARKIGLAGDESALRHEFDVMDSNRGGKVLFDEFCMYLAKKKIPAGGKRKLGLAAKSQSTPATPIPKVAQLPSVDQNKLQQVWEVFDVNKNGICSLAEIDRAVVTILPQYANNKAAIMRAYKAADTSKDGFVQRREFENMIRLLSYYSALGKLFKKLDKDNDNRVNFLEFKQGYQCLGLGSLQDDLSLHRAFERMDTNKGGYVLFDEFCFYMAQQAAMVPRTPAVDTTRIGNAPNTMSMTTSNELFSGTNTIANAHFTSTYKANFVEHPLPKRKT
eukprot:TRINITY_DN3650_c0_g1_i1.p1 TRINITY_DN3650_c0_g1~~TRINITY_DN3650_c0_g1_i1.p1  ORF type:complete len:395 (-),score=96.31 TRINITY_DN3650_c0_g1_i1:124-1260(-)